MPSTQILLPVLVQVALTFLLLFWQAMLRAQSLQSGEVSIRNVALNEPNWPTKPTQVANCFNNQFQLPILFFVVVILAQMQGVADWVMVILAWVFAVSRLAHAYIHTTSNRFAIRFRLYTVGFSSLLGMWVWFALRAVGGV